MSAPHRLTEKDKVALTATCSVCGPGSAIRKNGKYDYVCLTARRQAKKRWAQAHPDRARASRAYDPSEHRLTKRDGSADTCAVCGPVEVKAWGRGWMCANRFKELRWTSEQTEPAPRCDLCSKFLVDGKCPKCEPEPVLEDSLPAWYAAELAAAGMHLETEPSWLENDYESAVPGWKTLGSAEQWTGVKPEYAALYGRGRL